MSESRALRVCIVGSGPSGFYAAEALLREKGLAVEIDMLDRLPTPYGLVRGGVAPDHQKIKSVIQVYEKTALNPAFRFFGNVKVGRDVPADDLRRLYDAVIYAVGNETDKHMGIPGEDLAGSHAATAFVGWYNSHPDWRDRTFDLSCERVAVVGVGNVAMDVTRILAQDPDELAKTDIAGYALETLRTSKVREILLLGRRGPAQAAFSPAEIQEIAALKSADLVVDPRETELDEATLADLRERHDSDSDKNVAFLKAQAQRGEGRKSKKVRLRFLLSPVEILGSGGRVSAIRVEKNRLVKDKDGVRASGTGQFETISVGKVFRSVGYYGVALPGVPFDEEKGRIPNAEGRVSGKPGEYVVGWAKRGPSGLIGTNRADSVATVAALLADFKGRPLPESAQKSRAAALAFLTAKKPDLVTFEDWKRLDKIELDRGAQSGKVREKFSDVPAMLAALGKAARKS